MSRILVGLALVVGGLLGLFMTACGGIFTLTSLGGGSGGIQGVLALSAPSLVGGVLLLAFVKRKLQAFRAASQGPPPTPPQA